MGAAHPALKALKNKISPRWLGINLIVEIYIFVDHPGIGYTSNK